MSAAPCVITTGCAGNASRVAVTAVLVTGTDGCQLGTPSVGAPVRSQSSAPFLPPRLVF